MDRYYMEKERPRVGQVPLMIFAYLGFSLFISGFILTILAYAPKDSYLMVMIQEMGVMGFLGPIILVLGTIMVLVSVMYCMCNRDDREDDD